MKKLLIAIAALLACATIGCETEPINAPAPPHPPLYQGEVPPLIRSAERNGFRAGYAPRRDEKYRDAPGYDYRLGPIQPYVDAFRNSYLSGYERGFYDRGPDPR